MPSRSVLALAAALVFAGCNKPSPTPEAAVPDTGSVDTVAAAGAPIADSANAMADSAANVIDTTVSVADSTVVDSVK